MNKFKNILIPLSAVIVSSLLCFTSLDNKIADLFQRALKSTPESSSVLLVNVDDITVEQVGTYPLGREVYAKSLIALKDLGASQAIFDLSFIDKGLAKIDERYISEDLSDFIRNSFDQMDYGLISPSQAMNDILISVSHSVNNSDTLLSDTLKFFGDSYVTLTFDSSLNPDDNYKDYLGSFVALPNVISDGDTITPEQTSLTPAIFEFVSSAQNAGFVNGTPDDDGYLRRLNMVFKYEGKYYGGLAFVPILKRFGNPGIKISNSKITLLDCDAGDGTKKDIVIPRSRDGSLLLKYPKKVYDNYNGISLWNIYRLYLLEEQFTQTIQEMDQNGFFSLWEDENPADYLNAYLYLREELYNGENPDIDVTFQSYSENRQAFWSLIHDFLSEETENNIYENYEFDDESLEFISQTLADAREEFNEYKTSFENVQSVTKGASCIFGAVATSSTDSGLIQYEENFPRVGMHYTLANQILAQDFVDDSNPFISIVLALILCLLYYYLSSKIKSTGRQIIFGLAVILGTIVLLLSVFCISRTFIGTSVPIFSLVITFLVVTIYGFLTASKDKKFITNAFSQCLAPAVVQELVKHPESFKLGGDTFEMSAIFTDIQKFSGFSELLSASQLVALLNYYLTKMTDILMEQGATVDKFEGDAIVAFVGAPYKYGDHAKRLCRAALNMKEHELHMNDEIRSIAQMDTIPEGMLPSLFEAFKIMVQNNRTLFTRIGINSGDMVAGYMGSDGKKNYTMMGNNVNLASRLEGVNKQYSTGGILISESTRKLLDNDFIVRSLDRVRVVNVNTPLRLYELMAENDENNKELSAYVQKWEEAMATFENGDYEKSLSLFQALSSEKPEDKVALYYIDLISRFFIKGSYPTEQDSFGVEYIPEDKVFKLLQK